MDLPADGNRAAYVGTRDFGTSPIFVQLSDKQITDMFTAARVERFHVHEERNRRWAEEQGALLRQHDPATAGGWLREWVEDGTLARAAWSGYLHLPALGLYEIVDELG